MLGSLMTRGSRLRGSGEAGAVARVLLVAAIPFLSGCMSAVIVSVGKPQEYLQSRSTTPARAQWHLGAPAYSQRYSPPVQIRNTPEFRYNAAHGGFPFAWGIHECADGAVTALCEVYTRRGPYVDMLRGEVYGLIAGLTFGIGDIVCLPYAIRERWQLSRRYFSITFWYDEQGRYIACSEGDITNPASNFELGEASPTPPGRYVAPGSQDGATER